MGGKKRVFLDHDHRTHSVSSIVSVLRSAVDGVCGAGSARFSGLKLRQRIVPCKTVLSLKCSREKVVTGRVEEVLISISQFTDD